MNTRWRALEAIEEFPPDTPVKILVWGGRNESFSEGSSLPGVAWLTNRGYTHYAIIEGPKCTGCGAFLKADQEPPMCPNCDELDTIKFGD